MLADTPELTHIAAAAPQLGDLDDTTRRALSAALARACSDFGLYTARFREAGLTEGDIRSTRPLEVLRQLPRLDASDLPTLFRQSLDVNREIIDLEASSGTTGVRKRRPITYDDAQLETRKNSCSWL
jgi:phenylacetate-coenzyme A ligase PaaK-like adenylate-forming protein